MSKSVVIIEDMKTIRVGGYKITLPSDIRQYYEFANCFVVRMASMATNESNLVGYSYSESNFSIKWSFENNNVIRIIPEQPTAKKINDFVSSRHYEDFVKKFTGKELLIVQVGNFGYRIDANTGEIYGKWETR